MLRAVGDVACVALIALLALCEVPCAAWGELVRLACEMLDSAEVV